ncbi:MAG TPA: MXAN_6652 family MXYO-CTERM-anchored protein [Archangium sp.]|uniref:MXAN_6652 family MXYO-CTERM-anchored protein n=1 Tax=Archangium sp. TaxID=1872627 RepID=UPI002E35E5AF|nr:MXAN_6652 family MXYO-CTERM-anchored protein [Archangium sp.]HEX5747138.1 MXAN_6652 family MXYO-CTERM-anchored protein [Archangium sp.]
MKFPSYAAAGVLSACLLSAPAFAYSAGMTGNSGKSAATCSTCHAGGSAPTVTLTGPSSLAAGATGQYTLTITGGPGLKGGMNVAVDNTAASLEPGTGTGIKKVSNELTHNAPKPAASGAITFNFSLVAPPSAGTVRIFAAGNSVNGDNNSTGDASATATLPVTVTGNNEPQEEEKGGCSSAGGAPVLAFALTTGLALLRRRRRS